ncbi:MAG: LCP family protein [Oscillospiraceae bacterium]|nr:LCP family protein [Oscillospiraceae bacterium]
MRNNEEFVNINNRSGSSRGSAPKHGAPKKKKTGKLVIRCVSLFLTILCFVGAIGLFYAHGTLYSINYKSQEDLKKENPTTPTGETAAKPEDITLNPNSGELLSDDYVLNIMLYGTDNSEALSDTMILLSIDSRHQKIKMTSFLRDTYVAIPTVGAHKLNYAYAVGGAPLSIQTIEQNYGIKIDKYAMVTFSAFKEIVDILGGVEIELTADEIGYINGQIHDNNQTEYLNASEGLVKLNGQQALWYARNRGGTYGGVTYSGDDWDRTDRQRKFMSAVIDQVKTASLGELIGIVNAIGPCITTDLKKTEITGLMANALSFLNYKIVDCSMPANGLWSYGFNHAGSVILVDDWYQARLKLAEFIYEEAVQASN